MKILFLMRDDGNMTEPMGIMLLSALAKQNRPNCTTHVSVMSEEDTLERVRAVRPDIVAFSMITGSHQDYLNANRAIKKKFPRIKTVGGGPYCTFSPRLVMREPLDAICCGEGDYAWIELLDALEAGRSVDGIKNIVTHNNVGAVTVEVPSYDGKIREWRATNLRAPLKDRELDSLPFMDRDLIYNNTAFGHRTKRTMMTSRGCPFVCTYCFEGDFYKMYRTATGPLQVFQRMSVERVIAELEEMAGRWHTTFIKFYDDIFTSGRKEDPWIAEFSEKYPKKIGLPFHFLTRCDLISEWDFQQFVKAGLQKGSMTMSIESGNSWIRDHVMDRKMKEEAIRKAFSLAWKYGIKTFTNIIFAVPVPEAPRKEHGMNPIDYDIESIKMCSQIKVSWVECPNLYPYAGTPLYGYLVSQGFFSGNLDDLGPSYQGESPLSCFTEKEKMQQVNLSLLGPCLTLFSGSRSWTANILAKPLFHISTKFLIYLPFTKAYLFLFNAVRNYVHLTRIYAPGGRKLGLMGKLRFCIDNFMLDWAKRFRNKPGQKYSGELTLGGTPPE